MKQEEGTLQVNVDITDLGAFEATDGETWIRDDLIPDQSEEDDAQASTETPDHQYTDEHDNVWVKCRRIPASVAQTATDPMYVRVRLTPKGKGKFKSNPEAQEVVVKKEVIGVEEVIQDDAKTSSAPRKTTITVTLRPKKPLKKTTRAAQDDTVNAEGDDEKAYI
jgi:hypothetical protein